MYNLFETDEFLNSIDKLQQKDASFISSKLISYVYPQIRKEPHFELNIKKLKNYTPEIWRYRIGNYRFFYSIDEEDNLVLLFLVKNRHPSFPS